MGAEEIGVIKRELEDIKESLENIKLLLEKGDEKMDSHISFIMLTYKSLEPALNVIKTLISPITFPIRWTTRMILS